MVRKENGRRIRNQRDLKRAIQAARGKSVSIEVNRNGITSMVQVKGGKDLGFAHEAVRKR